MLDSDVRPTRGRIEDPGTTRKNRNDQHMYNQASAMRYEIWFATRKNQLKMKKEITTLEES